MFNTEQRYIYEKYFDYYGTQEGTLRGMILAAVKLGENACNLYEEYASPSEPSVTGDDLERIFEEGIEGRPSIQSLIEGRAKGYRHILKFRTAVTLDCTPTVSVRYTLVWKKNAALKIR